MAYPENRNGKLTGRWYGETRIKHERFRHCFDSKKEAEGYEAYVKATGTEPPYLDKVAASGPTFAEAATELKSVGGPKGRWHRGRDQSVIDRLDFIASLPLGKLAVSAISYTEVERLVEDLKKRPGKDVGSKLSTGTINRYLTAISAVMTYAERKGHIQAKPELPWQEESKKKQQAYTDPMAHKVIAYLRSEGHEVYAQLAEILGTSGLRWGELASLTAEQIVDEFIELDDPEQIKNEEPRVVWIGEENERKLRAIIASGALPKYDTFYKGLRKAVKACGYKLRRPIHALRHTASTRTVNEESDIQVAKELLGHKSIQTTLRYRHISRQVLRERAKKLDPRRGELAQNTSNGEVLEFPSTQKAV